MKKRTILSLTALWTLGASIVILFTVLLFGGHPREALIFLTGVALGKMFSLEASVSIEKEDKNDTR